MAGRFPAGPIPVYVCICNGVTDRDIRQAAEAGCRSVAELTMRTGCGATCGSCLDMAAQLLDEGRQARDAVPLPVLQAA
jgi:bacterioferritin-associated ferredoxin